MSSLKIINMEHQEVISIVKEFGSYLKNAKCNYIVGKSSFIIKFEDSNHTAVHHVVDVCNTILEDVWDTSNLAEAIESSNDNIIIFDCLNGRLSIY